MLSGACALAARGFGLRRAGGRQTGREGEDEGGEGLWVDRSSWRYGSRFVRLWPPRKVAFRGVFPGGAQPPMRSVAPRFSTNSTVRPASISITGNISSAMSMKKLASRSRALPAPLTAAPCRDWGVITF